MKEQDSEITEVEMGKGTIHQLVALHNIGDEVYYLDKNTLNYKKITDISFIVSKGNKVTVSYTFNNYDNINETRVFKTQKELFNSLKEGLK